MVILGACDADDGDFERAGEELVNRVEETVQATQSIERDLQKVADELEQSSGSNQ